ncbi:ATP-binding cassette domain-containing protein [Oxalobacter vibrioformis]|uniref:Probable ATP-binding protein YheS n=1 Tax=Oxalobacter vibrioformis TaxID=933080 RepID=A0A9E9P516_9BURK|nr:ATP-binding cassette domain-containing protein [Oxalobacter vibrioformis]WAW10666.1 ATP-binding cassette domain-containing protein [Oxalobacter vibrioformis]
MIRFQHVNLMRGTKSLLEQADAILNPGEKIGLIGPNGAGKTSLFSLLNGELHPDQGEVDFPASWRISYVRQEIPALEKPALEYVIDGDTHLRELQSELARLETAQNSTGNGLRIAELHTSLEEANAYTVHSRAEQLLLGLGFTQEELGQPVSTFSGGWRMRLNLAQALIAPSDLMLLDEPTNHLDLDAIIWLEDWLKRYSGTLVIISHDRDFLDGIVNVILHIDDKKLRRYNGNYSAFERQRAEQLVLMQSAIEKQTKKRAHLESFVRRFRAKATKARQAQSRLKALEKMEALAPLRAAAEFSFEFREPESSPNPLLVMEDINAGYPASDEKGAATTILTDINFSLQTGERIGLLGVNGAGKSTFIKTIAGELLPLTGRFTTGKGLNIGYFAQHQVDMLRNDESPLWHLARIAPEAREQDLRNFLGGFLFPGTMATTPIAPLSGGEKARLALAIIVWQRPNLLLLDEPTNHLDLQTREALTDALAQFEGTLVLVSHDRHLLRATTDSFLIVSNGSLQPFDGDLDDYRNWLYQTRQGKEPDLPAQTVASSSESEISRRDQRRQEAEERQRLSALKKPIEERLKRIEREMEKLQPLKAAIDDQMSSPEIYAAQNKEKLKQLLVDQAYYAKALGDLEEEWLQRQEELEKIVR